MTEDRTSGTGPAGASDSPAVPALTRLQETLLCKALARDDHRVVGGPPESRRQIVVADLARFEGRWHGYDRLILTAAGVARAEQVVRDRVAHVRRPTQRERARAYDVLVSVLRGDGEITQKIDLPDGTSIEVVRELGADPAAEAGSHLLRVRRGPAR